MPEWDSSKRLRRSASAFSAASRIGAVAILGCTVLLLASSFGAPPRVYWRICFGCCVLALGVLVLGYLMLAWNSPGYGFDGSHILTYLFWLLILCGLVAVAFGFTARNRVVALVGFATGTVVCGLLTPLFHYSLFDSIRRAIRR